MSFLGGLFGSDTPQYRPPPAPNPTQTAQAQSEFNRNAGQQTQEFNMVNQSNPYGSMN